MRAETVWPCASWCESVGEHGICIGHLGPYPSSVRVTLGQEHTGYGARPAPDVALQSDDRLVCLQIPAAAEMADILRALGHDELADAVQAAVELSGAVPTDRYGRQRWELPA